ncbi:MAG: AAA family ATPase [Bacteroidota bacterium]
MISPAPPTLVITCGLPGAGKTTHARRLERELGAVRFGPDEWMEALGMDLYDEAGRLGARAELHVVTASLPVLLQRVQRRGRETPPITLADLKEWAGLFETPTASSMELYDAAHVIGTQ